MPATAQRFEFICHRCNLSHVSQLDMLPSGWSRHTDVDGELHVYCTWCQNGLSKRGHGEPDCTIHNGVTAVPTTPPAGQPKAAAANHALTPLKRLMIAVEVATGRLNNLTAAATPDSEDVARAVEQYQIAHFELSAEVERMTGVAPLILIRALSL